MAGRALMPEAFPQDIQMGVEVPQNRIHIEAIHQRRLVENASIVNDYPLTAEFLFADARRSAGRVKQLLDEKLASRQSELDCGCVAGDAAKVLDVKYYKLLSDLYEKNVKLMNCVVAYLNDEISNGRKNQAELDNLYSPLIRWLNNMEKEVRRVLALPSSEIGEQFEEMRVRVMGFLQMVGSSISTHPKKYGAAVGALASGVLLHKYFAGACMSTKLLAKLGLVKCGCGALGWGAALGVGVIGGVFLVVVGTCIYNAFSPDIVDGVEADLRPEPAFQFEDVNRAVDNMKEAVSNLENGAFEQELLKIAAYWDQFNDFDPEVDTTRCPVCLAETPEMRDRNPVRFRGCVGRHFHCFECREACLHRSAGGGMCTICRNAPEN